MSIRVLPRHRKATCRYKSGPAAHRSSFLTRNGGQIKGGIAAIDGIGEEADRAIDHGRVHAPGMVTARGHNDRIRITLIIIDITRRSIRRRHGKEGGDHTTRSETPAGATVITTEFERVFKQITVLRITGSVNTVGRFGCSGVVRPGRQSAFIRIADLDSDSTERIDNPFADHDRIGSTIENGIESDRCDIPFTVDPAGRIELTGSRNITATAAIARMRIASAFRRGSGIGRAPECIVRHGERRHFTVNLLIFRQGLPGGGERRIFDFTHNRIVGGSLFEIRERRDNPAVQVLIEPVFSIGALKRSLNAHTLLIKTVRKIMMAVMMIMLGQGKLFELVRAFHTPGSFTSRLDRR